MRKWRYFHRNQFLYLSEKLKTRDEMAGKVERPRFHEFSVRKVLKVP